MVLEAIEKSLDYAQVSREKASHLECWQLLERSYADGMLVGTIMISIKGGPSIGKGDPLDCLPGSLVDMRPLNNISHLIGQNL